MLRKWAVIGGIGASLVAMPLFADEKEEAGEQHQAITMDQLPDAVRSALQKEAKGKKIENIKKETEKNGQTRYEAEVVSGNKGTDLEFDESGKVVERRNHSESKEKKHQHKE
ncbi:MAG TPA: hypothetical protein VI384_03000 [Candidatus Dormibacteraeota bacterium]